MPQQFLSVRQAARRLGVDDITVRRRIHDGTLPAYHVGEKTTIRIDERDLERLVRPVVPKAASR